MPTPTLVSQVNNPITGVFGNGLVQVFGSSGTWTVPDGVNNVRVRIFGAGGGGGGGGGGFGLKTVYNLAGSGVTTVAVTVGAGGVGNAAGATSSFGAYLSVTGGGWTSSASSAGGASTGGDINYTGGQGYGNYGGGGVANIFGNGGTSQQSTSGSGSSGTSGGGAASSTNSGGSGLTGAGGFYAGGAASNCVQPTPGNTLGSIANDQKIIQDLENGLSGAVCDLIGKFTNKAKTIKNNLISNVPNTTNAVIPSIA